MKNSPKAPQYITIGGQRAVVLEEAEYQRLAALADEGEPELPPANERGNYPAVETLRVSIARDIIRKRRAVGLTHVELARRAGIRSDIVSRVEQGKYSPSVVMVEKIEGALDKAGREGSNGGRRRKAGR